MAIVASWCQYHNTSPYSLITQDLPALDLGVLLQTSGASTDKFVVGLRFAGTAVINIKTWMEDSLADIYPLGQQWPNLRQNLHSAGFQLNACVFRRIDAFNFVTGTGWVDLLDPATSHLSVGAAVLGPDDQAFSDLIGLQFVAPGSTPIEQLRNFRLLAEFQVDVLP